MAAKKKRQRRVYRHRRFKSEAGDMYAWRQAASDSLRSGAAASVAIANADLVCDALNARFDENGERRKSVTDGLSSLLRK